MYVQGSVIGMPRQGSSWQWRKLPYQNSKENMEATSKIASILVPHSLRKILWPAQANAQMLWWALGVCVSNVLCWKVSLPGAGSLEPDHLQVPFWPKPFSESVNTCNWWMALWEGVVSGLSVISSEVSFRLFQQLVQEASWTTTKTWTRQQAHWQLVSMTISI